MAEPDDTKILIARSGAGTTSGMLAYNIEYQEGGPLVTVTVTVVIAEQGSEAANRRRAWDEARALVGRFVAQRPPNRT